MEEVKKLIDGLIIEFDEFEKESAQEWEEICASIKPNEQSPKFKKGDKVKVHKDCETVFTIKRIFGTPYSYKYEMISPDVEHPAIIEERYLESISNE